LGYEWSMMTSLLAQGGISSTAAVRFFICEWLQLHSEASQGLLKLLIHLWMHVDGYKCTTCTDG
jgi:hypothetical protein